MMEMDLENLEAIEKLNLLDNNLMTLVFDRNTEAIELLLNVILQRNDLKVLEVIAEDTDLPIEEVKKLAGSQLV